MRIVFIGASNFGLKCLEACFEIPEVDVTGIITASKTFRISYNPEGVMNVLHADVFELAHTRNVPVKKLELSMNEPGLLEAVSVWKPDAFLVAGWYHMIPKSWRKLAPAFGLHASLLPNYSGGAPLVWALLNGEKKTGITMFQMDDGVDSGPIVGQREEHIYLDDTIASLYTRIEQQGLILIRETLPQMVRGTLKLVPQDETKRRIVPQRSPKDGYIDWSQDARIVERFIRAQTRPYPGAFSILNAKPLHIWAATLASSISDNQVGQVHRINDDTYAVGCGTGSIYLEVISYESQTYARPELARIFAGGGQLLGESQSCLRISKF
jgi:methionyl-tRNA formyltransferase